MGCNVAKMGVKSAEVKLFKPGSELQKWFSASAAKLEIKRLLQLPSPEAMVEHCLAIANAEGGGGCPEVEAAESIKNLGRSRNSRGHFDIRGHPDKMSASEGVMEKRL